jgi:two-component system sensor histidine kinase KdpD
MTTDSTDSRSRRFPVWAGILASLAAVGLGTLLVYPLDNVAPVVSLGIVYLPGVLLISILWGWRLGLFTAVVSVAAFNWFHIPPLNHITVAHDRDLVALVVFVVVAFVASSLAEVARARTEEAERGRERADRALAELAELSRERDRMQAEAVEAEALRRSDELKTSLLRSVSHDLRTPLTSMIAAGSALGSPTLTESERAELSEAVVGQGNRLSRLVENLLDISSLETGGAEPRREQVDLGEVLEAARDSIGADREAVRVTAGEDLPTLRADATQLERAFANLFENAVRHGEGRPVLVRSRLVGPRLVIRVVDQGPGIPQADRGRIFEPFYRGEAAGNHTGSGLGLAIAKGFVEANGGEIAVESLASQGTTFVISFPVSPTEEEAR